MKNTIDKIYLFGNSLLEQDSLPLRLEPRLRERFPDIELVYHDPNENLHPSDGRLMLIDSVEGIDKAMIITDPDQISSLRTCSLHDLDLAFNLKLLTKIGELRELVIFGVPMEMSEDAALDELTGLINSIISNIN